MNHTQMGSAHVDVHACQTFGRSRARSLKSWLAGRRVSEHIPEKVRARLQGCQLTVLSPCSRAHTRAPEAGRYQQTAEFRFSYFRGKHLNVNTSGNLPE